MQQKFEPNLSLEERLSLLQTNADNIIQMDYTRAVSPEELANLREDYTDKQVVLATKIDEMKEAMKEMKDDIKMRSTENKQILKTIKLKFHELSGTVYCFVDHIDKMVYGYDQNGDLVYSRRIRPDENQGKLFDITNNKKLKTMQDLNVTLDGLQGPILTVREGAAAEIKPPLKIVIDGQINAVSEYLKVRYQKDKGGEPFKSLQTVEPNLSLIIVDEDAMSITLKVSPEDFYGPEIIGKLKFNEDLLQFKINAPVTMGKDDIVKLLRFNRRFFEDFQRYDVVLESFKKFNAQATTNIELQKDLRGNKVDNYNKTIASTLATDFILNVQVFKGQQDETFRVDICFDVTDGGPKFWLESVELNEIIQQRKIDIIAGELEHCKDFVIIRK